MRGKLKHAPYLYFALVASVILVKNLMHPAIEIDWWLPVHFIIIIVFVAQSYFRLLHVDLILSIVTFGYSLLLFLSAYTRNLIFQSSFGESFILILFLLLNFYAAVAIFINASEKV